MAGGMTVGTLDAYLRLDDSQFNDASSKAEGHFSGLKSVASGTMSAIWGTAKLAAGGLAVVGAAGLRAGITTASGLEQAQVAFTTMLGSGQAAQSFLTDLQKFAAATPFEFPDLVQSSQRLMAMGVAAKDVKPYLTAIGDAVAGLGGGKEQVSQVTTAIGQMAAKGKIQSDEMMQLTEAGIPALRILADSYGITTAKMQDNITKGIVPSSEALPKLIAGLENGTASVKGFGGMMAGQSQTMSGLWSTLMDTLNMGASTVIQPLVPLIKEGLGGATAFAASMMPRMANGVASIVAKAQGLYSLLVEGDFNGKVRDAFGWEEDDPMVDHILRIRDAAIGLFDLIVKGDFTTHLRYAFNWEEDSNPVAKILTIRDALVGLFDLIVKGDFTGHLRYAFGWEEDSPVVAKILAIRDAVLSLDFSKVKDGISGLFSNGDVGGGAESAAGSLTKLMNSLAGVAHALGTGVIGGAKLLGAALTFLGDHIGTIIKFMPLIIAAFIAWKAAQTAANLAAIASLPLTAAQIASNFALASANRALALALGYTRTSMLQTMIQGIKSAASMVWAATTTAASAVWSAAVTVAGWVAMAAAAVVNAAIVVAGWVLMGVQSMIQAARMAAAWFIALGPIGWVTAAVIAIGVLIYENWDRIVGWTKAAWSAVSDFVTGAVDWVVNFVKDHWGLLLAILTGPIGIAVFLIRSQWDNITRGVSAMVDMVRNLFGTMIQFVTGIPGKILGALGSLGSLLVGAGRSLLDGMQTGISNGWAFVWQWLTGLGSKIINSLPDMGTLLLDAGKKVIQGLIDGILSMKDKVGGAMGNIAGKIKGFLPGSPVKEGPLTSWNNGAAGIRLMQMLADGIVAGGGMPGAAMTDAMGGLAPGGVAGGVNMSGAGAGASSGGRQVNITMQNYGPRITASDVLTELNVADLLQPAWA